jgi:hypothetical protein
MRQAIRRAVVITTVASVSLLGSAPSWAWGKRGHEIVAGVAARVLAEKRGNAVLRPFAYDLGYYANVPDLIWRNLGKDIGAVEGPQHFIDWSPRLDKVFGSPLELPLTFEEYKAKLGEPFDPAVGVVPYRIHDLAARCKTLVQGYTTERHPALLVCLGTLAHYTGDIGQPLHVTEEYDGKATGQAGIHSFFETTLVDVLYPGLAQEVEAGALAAFDKSPLREMASDKAVRWTIADSYGRNAELVRVDKETGRADLVAAADKQRALIVERLIQASILTAVVWDETLGGLRSFSEKPLYGFDGCPAYVEPDPAFRAAVEAAPKKPQP